MALYKNKYRIESTRLKGWDYSSPGAYFVTIVTKNRVCYFGKVEDGDVYLNELGEIAKQCFEKIPEHFPFVSMDAFVIMPNHVHGIVIINKPDDASVETLQATSLQQQSSPGKNKKMESISPKSGTLSTIMRSFKSAVTKSSRLINPHFAWQSRFHDHIIRNEQSFWNIVEYIVTNPARWQDDTNFEKI